MVNEERVKHLYKIALYEQSEEKLNRPIGKYYKSDYIGKEMIKSIFTGTFAFGCLALLWLFRSWEDVLDSMNSLEIVETAIHMAIVYGIFMVIYLVITYIVYAYRYEARKKRLKEHTKTLKRVYQMYEREEKLKQ